jgi:IstB-like ATP binding protein
MTPLEQKLNQLTLSTMSRHVETTLTEAAAKNLSASATLEWLVDLELDARKQRAIERRYKCARLQAQPSIDAFHFPASQDAPASQAAHLAPARSGVPH